MSEPERGRSFNNVASGIAAFAGVIGLAVSTHLSSEVNKLTAQSRTAGLVGDLTDKLTSKELGRDISLLALEHTLNSKPGNEYSPDKLLLARIATLLIDGSPGEDAINDQKNNTHHAKTTQSQFNHGVDQAARVLARLIESSGETCKNYYDQILDLDSKLTASKSDIEMQCGEAGALAIETLRRQIKGKDIDGETTFSASQLANENISDPSRVASSLAQVRVVNQLNQARLESDYSANPNTDPSLAVVTVHVDGKSIKKELESLLKFLSQNKWYIVSGTRVVEPSAESCGEYNSVRFFHESDRERAEELISLINSSKLRFSADIQKLVSGTNNTKEGLTPIGLQGWRFSSSVPERSLELWLAAKGKECKAIKAR